MAGKLEDVAAVSGVSRSTVSRVLSGGSGVVGVVIHVGSGTDGAAALLDAGVDAIFAASDSMALGAIEELQRRGLRVPHDVAVVGFDDLPEARACDPPLTTVRQDERLIGREAARTLFALLNDPDMRPQRVILPTELLIRSSTVAPPV